MGVQMTTSSKTVDEDLMTTPAGDPVMTVKLEPPRLPPWWVTRKRLSERLTHAAVMPLTLVTGRAGAGKSTAVADWLTDRRHLGRGAWLALEAEDDRPDTLWCYVLASLARCGVAVPAARHHIVPDDVDRSLLIRLAVSLAAQPEPVVLVLDDAHRLSHPAVIYGLRFLVDHAGSALRLVLVGRHEPPLPLHRHRLNGSITEIRDSELLFTADEAEAALAAHGARLDRPEIAAIVDQTSGWAAALRLQARALTESSVGASQTELADYIRSELLAEQPAATRELLIRTSIADELPEGLAVDLTGRQDAGQVLDQLAHTGAVVTARAGTERIFVHQPLVRQVLLKDLQHSAADTLGELHHQAARWCLRVGRLVQALPHALAAGDWELASTIVVRSLTITEILISGEANRQAAAFADMPTDLHTPEVSLVRAATALADGDLEKCARSQLRAVEMIGTPLETQDALLSLSMCAVEVALARRTRFDDLAGVSETAERTTEQARARGVAIPDAFTRLFSLARAESLLYANDLNGAADALRACLAATGDPAAPWTSELCGRVALIEALRGRLRRADELAHRSLQHAVGSPETALGEVALAWTRTEQHHLAAARQHADRAATLLTARPDPVATGILALIRARIHRAHGHSARAVDALEHHSAEYAGRMPAWLAEVLAVTRDTLLDAARPPAPGGTTTHHALATATAAIAAGDTATAHSCVTASMTRRVALDVQVSCWLITTSAELADGDHDRARRALQRALRLAEPQRLRRPLLEAPAATRRLLREDPTLGQRHGWLTNVDEAPTTAPLTAVTPVVETLTVREQEVLGHLSHMLSTEQIAQTMYVSVSTVRTHIRGVLRKLAATRRHEAVRRARELRLI